MIRRDEKRTLVHGGMGSIRSVHCGGSEGAVPVQVIWPDRPPSPNRSGPGLREPRDVRTSTALNRH
jgi:hypothetical protein